MPVAVEAEVGDDHLAVEHGNEKRAQDEGVEVTQHGAV